GDGRERLLERGSDGGRHRLGTPARQARAHRDGREVHRREVAHRQTLVRHDPEHQNPRHDQGGHHGATDEQPREAHRCRAAGPLGGVESLVLVVTLMPGVKRDCPSVTTTSPSATPQAIPATLPAVRSRRTGRCWTTPAESTTYTYVPCCPVSTAGAGTTSA